MLVVSITYKLINNMSSDGDKPLVLCIYPRIEKSPCADTRPSGVASLGLAAQPLTGLDAHGLLEDAKPLEEGLHG